MRGLGGWVLLVIAVVLCLGAAYGAYTLANYSWAQVAGYQSLYVSLDLPASGRADALTPRTVFVIVDGLTETMSRQLQTMNRLRSYGTDLVLTAGQPSLSYPNWTNLLSGAPPQISGVTTNDYVGPVKVETLFQAAQRSDVSVAFVGPADFQRLYEITSVTTTSFMRPWSETKYMSGIYVDNAIRIAKASNPRLLVVHLPDIDEAGHRSGSSSADYQATAHRVDAELSRLVAALQDGSTEFVVASDHGHIAGGGHAGWEQVVVLVPGIFSGPGIPIQSGTALQSDIAPTVAVLAGIPVPRFSEGSALRSVIGTHSPVGMRLADEQRKLALTEYTRVVTKAPPPPELPEPAPAATAQQAVKKWVGIQAEKLAAERRTRVQFVLVAAAVAVLFVAVFAIISWRAFAAAAAGTAAFYLFYNGLFFVVHRYSWSLSVFNRSDQVDAFINMRVVEAALAGIVGAAVAAAVYPLLRRRPRAPRREYLSGWLALGPATMLLAIVTLGAQVAYFLWQWGVTVTWRLPDLKLAVKYDFDLLQIVGLGAVAILAPLVTWLVGRYHPKVRRDRTSAAS
jgi:hypothetical protein